MKVTRASEEVDRIASQPRYLVMHASEPLRINETFLFPLVEGDEDALFRAIKALVREYAVATYYTPPRSKG